MHVKNMQLPLPQASFDDMAIDFDCLFKDPEELTSLEAISHDRILRRHGAHSILDCACGTGIQAIGLARLGYRVYASDISSKILEQLRRKARASQLAIKTKQADFRDLEPWQEMNFDAVICSGNSLTLVPQPSDVLKALKSMFRVTRTRGISIIGLHNYSVLKREDKIFRLRHVAEESRPHVAFDLRELGKERVKVLYFVAEFRNRRWDLKSFVKSYLNLNPHQLTRTMKSAGYHSIRLYDVSGQREVLDGEWVLAVGEK